MSTPTGNAKNHSAKNNTNAKNARRLPRALLAIALSVYRAVRRHRTLLSAAAVIFVTLYGARFVWQRMRGEVFSHSDYQVELSEIEITPRPVWIRADIKAEALRDGSLDLPLSIVDEDLLEKIAKAFAFHPWVARVEQTRYGKQYPANIEIDLVYREPVAMIEVTGGLFPIDAQATLLPSADFSPLEAREYPRIVGIGSQPLGPVGTAWGDKAVRGGAQIAVSCAPVWKELQLQSIRWVNAGSAAIPASPTATVPGALRPLVPLQPIAPSQSIAPYFELVTKSGTAIPWGAAPGDSAASEPDATKKIARLKKYIAEHGGLDEAARRRDLDLRKTDGATRTALREN